MIEALLIDDYTGPFVTRAEVREELQRAMRPKTARELEIEQAQMMAATPQAKRVR